MNLIEKLEHYAIEKCCVTPPVDEGWDSGYIPEEWENRYTSLKLTAQHIWREDITGAYTPQGACTDGVFLYRALVKEDDEGTWLQKINLSTGAVVKESKSLVLGHANDMTYAKGSLYIAHSSSTNILYKVNPETFALEQTIRLGSTIWGIDYDPVNDLFVIGTVGSAYFSVYYPDFSFMYRIKPTNPYYGLVRQGIHCDDNYIYVALDNAYGAVIENNMGSRIMVYTWNGIFVKSIHVPIPEIEWVININGVLYIGTYEGRDPLDVKSGKIYRIAYDLYPEQTVLTGRPTEVSGGVNNLQRLPEGTPVRLWSGALQSGSLTLESSLHGLIMDEDAPFRYLRFRFKGANQQVFDWYPANTGVPCLREVDVTDAQSNTTIRIREMRLEFDVNAQTFTITSNHAEELEHIASTKAITITKYRDSSKFELIELSQIWGVV